MKRYFDLTETEKITLSQEQFVEAVKIEGIHRGIKPPIALDQAINQLGFNGFTIPADSTCFYEIMHPRNYGGCDPTGICFKTLESARLALQGAICIVEDGYGADKRHKIIEGEFSVRETYLTNLKQKSFTIKLEELIQESEAFEKLSEECAEDLSRIRQAKYDAAVRSNKRRQYLELAKGDEGIAKNFWSKTEGSDWPNE